MRNALHAEWTKLRTTPGPAWLLLAAVVLTVAVGAAASAATTFGKSDAGVDITKLSLAGVDLGQAVVAVLAVFVIGGEYGTGMINATLAAVPRRATVLAAKAAVLTGAVAAGAVLAVGGSLLSGRAILPGHGFTAAHGYSPLSLADGPTLRAAVGSVLYLVLVAVLSLGIATAVRDSASAIGVVLAVLYVFPILAQAVNPHWQRRVEQVSPMTAGLYVQATRGVSSLPLTPWQGVGVLAAWAAGALTLGALLLRMRDA